MTLARELFDAYASGDRVTVAPTAREGGCDLATAYATQAELTRMRRAGGRTTVGRKVAFVSKAAWRVLKIQTVAWADMYDDTVHYSKNGRASVSLARMRSPRIEPEVVMKLKTVRGGGPSDQYWLVGSHGEPILPAASNDAGAVLESVEWLALGFELVDCPFPDWKFQAPDLVASFGFHAGLVVGTPRLVDRDSIPSLTDELGSFTVRLSKDGELVEEGGGRNVMKSPGLCLAELASAIAAQPGAEPLRPGELVTTGSLTPLLLHRRWRTVGRRRVRPGCAASRGEPAFLEIASGKGFSPHRSAGASAPRCRCSRRLTNSAKATSVRGSFTRRRKPAHYSPSWPEVPDHVADGRPGKGRCVDRRWSHEIAHGARLHARTFNCQNGVQVTYKAVYGVCPWLCTAEKAKIYRLTSRDPGLPRA